VKKVQKFVIVFDSDGDAVVWGLHRDLSMRRIALNPTDLEGTEQSVVDLRSGDYVEHAPGTFAEK
jgi:hypothetical protein